jgi:predicted ABC-type transport system involved in lysophospholipase L1 biosynthesis ATPase subunit
MDVTLASMPSTGPEIALRAENLSKVYRSGEADLVIFANLGLEVRRGEMLALVGRSGQAHDRYDILRFDRHFTAR